jgi:N-acetylmuramoyl-L-alanine amidase
MNPLDIIRAPSPNFDARNGHDIDMLVLHYTGMLTGKEALDRLRSAESKVSSHYVVEEDGTVYQLVEESERAWHAGVSYWRGHTNINQRSIGIEIVNPGHEFGYRPFPIPQINALTDLCTDIVQRQNIPARNVIGHSDVAPQRKEDPGELFPWRELAQAGVGLFPPGIGRQEAGAENLALFGYDLSKPRFAVTAFQRHFRPATLDGEWDSECARLLAELLDMIRPAATL